MQACDALLDWQATAGDVRAIMPCGKMAAGPPRFPLGLTSFAGANLADDTMTVADDTVDPSFLVAVFSGFSVSTQNAEYRTPRPTRLSHLKSGMSSADSKLPSDLWIYGHVTVYFISSSWPCGGCGPEQYA